MLSIRRALVLVCVGIIPACGPTDTAKALLTPETRRDVQVAAASLNAVDRTDQTVQDAMIAGGSTGTGGAPLYPSDLALTVDLSKSVPGGLPRPSGMSGIVDVSASGTAGGDGQSGESTYSVEVLASTALLFQDPVSGVFARIPSGTTWTFRVHLRWTVVDSQNGSVIAEATDSWSGLKVDAVRSSTMVNVAIDGLRTGSTDYEWTAGTLTIAATSTEDATVTWTDSTGSNAVHFSADGPDAVVVTVGETTFGPLTATQLKTVFRVFGI